ncbi:MAG: hypothetical protein B9S32_14800 [Verrucomicrobia bacterium Tous-C9LFEB]|nr:MAG: hypothetical protein B9S32_14800 [Verrucomicrobia bacterium Tous-C9LFEB]
MRTFLLLLLAVTVSALCRPVSAATLIFSEDFESYTVGNELVSNEKWGSVTSSPTGTLLTATADPSAVFHNGTTNKYLRISDTSNAALTRLDSKPSSAFQLATLSLDFYEPSGVNGTYWNISFPGTASIDFNGGQIRINSGTYSTVYPIDATHHLDIVINNTTAAEIYGINSVASGTFDLWIDNVLILDNYALNSTTGTDLTKFVFSTSSGSYSQEMWIDNVSLYSGIAVPEPSAVHLLLLSMAALFVCQHCCRWRHA